MNISYRHLAMEAAISELDIVKSGEIDVLAALERDDFHLRPFTDSGISSERLLEARMTFMKELGAESGNIQDIKGEDNTLGNLALAYELQNNYIKSVEYHLQ